MQNIPRPKNTNPTARLIGTNVPFAGKSLIKRNTQAARQPAKRKPNAKSAIQSTASLLLIKSKRNGLSMAKSTGTNVPFAEKRRTKQIIASNGKRIRSPLSAGQDRSTRNAPFADTKRMPSQSTPFRTRQQRQLPPPQLQPAVLFSLRKAAQTRPQSSFPFWSY